MPGERRYRGKEGLTAEAHRLIACDDLALTLVDDRSMAAHPRAAAGEKARPPLGKSRAAPTAAAGRLKAHRAEHRKRRGEHPIAASNEAWHPEHTGPELPLGHN